MFLHVRARRKRARERRVEQILQLTYTALTIQVCGLFVRGEPVWFELVETRSHSRARGGRTGQVDGPALFWCANHLRI